MLLRRIFHHLRLVFAISVGLVLGSVVGGIYYLNQSGLNTEWRERIALELEKIGIVSDFESLSYDPTRGFIAKGVLIYADKSREDIVARLEHLVIDVDKTKFMRGKLRVNSISLKGADISLPIDPEEPEGARIIMKNLKGDMLRPDKRTVEARDLSGMVAGIRLRMNAHIWSAHLGAPKQPKQLKDSRVARLKLIARVIQEINDWHWSPKKPPQLTLYLEGNMDHPDSSRLDFELIADELERNGVTLRDVRIKGDYKNNLLTLDHVSFNDASGRIEGRADFRPSLRKGRFEADSTLHVQRLARKLFGIDIFQQLTFSTPPNISCTGTLELDEDKQPTIFLSGKLTIDNFSCLGSQFKHLATDFTSHGRDTFLTDLHLTHQQGELKGRILLKNETIRYEAVSTLPASAYMPFLHNSPIERTLNHATFNPQSKIHITAEGTMNRNNLTEWVAHGHAKFENFTYSNTPLHSLSGDYELSGFLSRFSNIKAHFDYSDYTLRRKFGGPQSARFKAESITVNVPEHRVRIKNIRGTAWPAPIVRLFVPSVADHVETYQFHRPPILSAGGDFDLRRHGKLTDFRIKLSSPGTMNYQFLDEPLTLRRLSARVHILSDRVDVTHLSYTTFQGACSGNIRVHTGNPNRIRYSGGMQFRRLHLKDIGMLYNFENAERGLLTGRIDFSGEDDNMRKFNGKGSLALEKGNLFSVPMLGPITQLIGKVLGKRNPTEEKAKDASCTYVIRKGTLYSNDFLATTRSLKFTGEGSLDLALKKMDLTIRMNARGLFGVLAFPLRPFMGLFQFKGTGPIMNPHWKTQMFVKPKRGKNDPIFRTPPRRARVVPE